MALCRTLRVFPEICVWLSASKHRPFECAAQISTNTLANIAGFSPKINRYASDNHERKRSRNGPWVPIAQESGPRADLRTVVWKSARLLPGSDAERCTAALLLDVDPVALVRTRRGPSGEGGALDQYVNDRPYVASSFLSVAIARVLGSALAGTSKGRPEMVSQPLPLVARITALPCRGG